MPIKYALFENHVTTDPNDYTAVVQITFSADTEALIKRVLEQGSTVTEADLRAAAADLVQAAKSYLLEGARVHFFGLADFYPRVKGVFNGPLDPFDRARHSVDVACNPGSRVREEVRAEATVERVDTIKPTPTPVEFADNGSHTTNDQITVGNIGQIAGSRLKFDVTKADEGVFFVPATGAAVRVPVADVQTNKPGKVIFLNPATLVPGTYHVEVRARQGPKPAGTDNRELRVGRLGAALTV